MSALRFLAVVVLLLMAVAVTHAQFAPPPPAWYWTVIDREEIALWHNGVQVGTYTIDSGTYLPRLGPGQWGVPEDPPCPVPEQFLRRPNAQQNWRTQGVIGPNGNPGVPNSGLHIRQAQPASKRQVSSGENKVPDYSTMPSLTFVAKDAVVADAAMQRFQSAPELDPWRQRYGRVKAYGYDDFQHTCYGFKLDEDKQFQQTGFVALVQPEPPDENGRAITRSIYECSSPQQFACALRDADADYHPLDGGSISEWEPAHLITAAGCIAATVAFSAIGLALRHRQKQAAQ